MLSLLHPLLKIDQREVECDRRKFYCPQPAIRERLESIGKVFLHGYHSALAQPDQQKLASQLERIGPEHRGFAYEGAAMAMALLDGITPRRKWDRFSRFVEESGKHHIYMLHVGAGWACARLPWLRSRIESVITRFHPVLGWLIIDGYGFHEGYFHWGTALQPRISRLSENARHVFYQGLGRSLWFVKGADACAITQTVSMFPPAFRGDAWSGVGLACAYAGGMNRAQLEELRRHAHPHCAALAQGAAFAAGARQLAGNPVGHTQRACKVLCGMDAAQAAALCDQTLEQTAGLGSCAYQEWRMSLQRILPYFSDGFIGAESDEFRPLASSNGH